MNSVHVLNPGYDSSSSSLTEGHADLGSSLAAFDSFAASSSAGSFLGRTVSFPKLFAVGVLNAILDLAALVLVGVAAFFGSEMVLVSFGFLHVGWGVQTVWGLRWCNSAFPFKINII